MSTVACEQRLQNVHIWWRRNAILCSSSSWNCCEYIQWCHDDVICTTQSVLYRNAQVHTQAAHDWCNHTAQYMCVCLHCIHSHVYIGFSMTLKLRCIPLNYTIAIPNWHTYCPQAAAMCVYLTPHTHTHSMLHSKESTIHIVYFVHNTVLTLSLGPSQLFGKKWLVMRPAYIIVLCMLMLAPNVPYIGPPSLSPRDA